MALRWEWRTFGDHVGAAERRLGSVQIESVAESAETYLISAEGRDAVKVRAGMMDVKHLEDVDDEGLQLWKPVMKSLLPISATEARSVLAALNVQAPLTRGSYDLDAIVGASTAVIAVPLQKTRRHFTFGGCMAELTDVRIADRSTRTIAAESESPARVLAAVRELGFDPRSNTSVPCALKALV